MNVHCHQCGARIRAGESTCLDRFNAIQLKEIENPDSYYKAHHLSVPCYLLQHNIYSGRRWLETYHLLERYVYAGLTPEEARQQLHGKTVGRQMSGGPSRSDKLPGVEQISWSRTIADVRDDTPGNYLEDVQKWAAAVLKDAEALVRSAETKE